MKNITQIRLWLVALMIGAITARATATERKVGAICGDPRYQEGCSPAGSHNLNFVLPDDGVARPEFRSDPFYAILLKSTEPCSVSDDHLRSIQSLFPQNKVFISRSGCEGPEQEPELMSYTNINEKFGFLAVYGGSDLAEAKRLLKVVRALKIFPGANIRRMQAILVYP